MVFNGEVWRLRSLAQRQRRQRLPVHQQQARVQPAPVAAPVRLRLAPVQPAPVAAPVRLRLAPVPRLLVQVLLRLYKDKLWLTHI